MYAGERRLAAGERNTALFKMACALRRGGAGVEVIHGCLEVLNRMCLMPLDELELEAIAKSAAKYAA